MSTTKKFKFVDTSRSHLLLINNQPVLTGRFVLYAKKKPQSPLFLLSTQKEKWYHSLAKNLVKFDKLGKLPITLLLDRINECQGIEATMVINKV